MILQTEDGFKIVKERISRKDIVNLIDAINYGLRDMQMGIGCAGETCKDLKEQEDQYKSIKKSCEKFARKHRFRLAK